MFYPLMVMHLNLWCAMRAVDLLSGPQGNGTRRSCRASWRLPIGSPSVSHHLLDEVHVLQWMKVQKLSG